MFILGYGSQRLCVCLASFIAAGLRGDRTSSHQEGQQVWLTTHSSWKIKRQREKRQEKKDTSFKCGTPVTAFSRPCLLITHSATNPPIDELSPLIIQLLLNCSHGWELSFQYMGFLGTFQIQTTALSHLGLDRLGQASNPLCQALQEAGGVITGRDSTDEQQGPVGAQLTSMLPF